MARRGTNERMDDPGVDAEELAVGLAFMRSMNVRHGGVSASLSAIAKASERIPVTEPLRILDVAAGSCDIPIAIARWAAGASRTVEITAIENNPATLNHAQAFLREAPPELASRVQLVHADARRLTDQFDPGSFHVVHTSMFLHHLPEIELLTVLRIMDRLATHAVIAIDILQSPVVETAARLLTLGKSEMIRHDARASAANAFSVREMKEIGHRVGLQQVRVRASMLSHRVTLMSEKIA